MGRHVCNGDVVADVFSGQSGRHGVIGRHIAADGISDVVIVNRIGTGHSHVLIWHRSRKTGPAAERIAFLCHVICDQRERLADSVLSHVVGSVGEIVAGDLISDVVSRDVDDEFRNRRIAGVARFSRIVASGSVAGLTREIRLGGDVGDGGRLVISRDRD